MLSFLLPFATATVVIVVDVLLILVCNFPDYCCYLAKVAFVFFQDGEWEAFNIGACRRMVREGNSQLLG